MDNTTSNKPQKKPLLAQLYASPIIEKLIRFPPIAWSIEQFVALLGKQELASRQTAQPILERPSEIGLEATMTRIVKDVVEALGYAGAMVATCEHGDFLPVRALYVDPKIATMEQIHRWEKEFSEKLGAKISLSDPEVARVCIYEEKDKENLSVRAAHSKNIVTSDELFDLFRPIAKPITKPFVDGIQKLLGVKEVIAVPFFLEAQDLDGNPVQEMVGNLFAAKCSRITNKDKLILAAFGRHVAGEIENQRRRIQVSIAQELTYRLQTSLNSEENVLNWIAEGVVKDLGYVVAMVATYEEVSDALPVRAFYIDPNIATMEQVHHWETALSEKLGTELSITDPDIARVYVNDPEYAENLSTKAVKHGRASFSETLYELFTPIVKPSGKPFVEGIQHALGIKKFIAVPFFLEAVDEDNTPTRQLIGNLFAGTRSKQFSCGEIESLKAFGQQAAAGIRNARLYHKSEERRETAEIFGKMAFSATASLHKMRNIIGKARMHIQLMGMYTTDEQLKGLCPELQKLLDKNSNILEQMVELSNLLKKLKQPLRSFTNEMVDVNRCLERAKDKVFQIPDEHFNVELNMSGDLQTMASGDMLIEAFKTLIKNAKEAIQEKGEGGLLRIESGLDQGQKNIEVTICDEGIGIKRENIARIFELGSTTKDYGLGFGLFWTKDYIEGLGGSIKVESIVGEGTTFILKIPKQPQPKSHGSSSIAIHI